jgi:hypothetical protein
MPYTLPDPDEEGSLVYSCGEEVENIRDLQHSTPVFAYNYLSLRNSRYCFNNSDIEVRDLLGYFSVVNEISGRTIKELLDSSSKEFHFHPLNDLHRMRYVVDNIHACLG